MTAAHDLFFLTHYAYNILNPLVEEAKAIEPSTQLSIEATFGHEDAAFTKVHTVNVNIHWKRRGMLAQSFRLLDKDDVDDFAATLRTKVEDMKDEARQDAKRELHAAAYSN